jgi:RNA polymerase sigma-70 factor (ECF subfamily)
MYAEHTHRIAGDDGMSSFGDTRSSVAALYARYYGPIRAYVARLIHDADVAEDLCQETFLKALRSWETRDPTGSAQAWLYRIARNTAYDYVRHVRRTPFTVTSYVEWLEDATYTMENRLETQEHIRNTLAHMRPHYRVPLMLRAHTGRSIDEIAELLGCSPNAAKTRLCRARRHILDMYGET